MDDDNLTDEQVLEKALREENERLKEKSRDLDEIMEEAIDLHSDEFRQFFVEKMQYLQSRAHASKKEELEYWEKRQEFNSS